MSLETNLKKYSKKYFVIIFVVFFAVYLSVFLRLHKISGQSWTVYLTQNGDAGNYVQLAKNLKNNGTFSLSKSVPFIAEGFYTPGYPFFVLVVDLIFRNYMAIPILQIFLVFLSGYLVFKIAQKVLSFTAGFFAFLFYIFSANVILHTLGVFTDVLYTFFTILAVYLLFFRNDNFDGKTNILLGGLVCGMAILIRPVGLLLPFIFGFSLLVCLINQNHGKLKRAFLLVLLFELAILAVIMPWAVRNKKVLGSLSVSGAEAGNFYFTNIPQYLCLKQDPKDCYDQKYMDNLLTSMAREIGYNNPDIKQLRSSQLRLPEYSSAMAKASIKIISADPFGFTSYYLKATLPRFFLSSSFKELVMELKNDKDVTKNNTLRDFAFRGEISSIWHKLTDQPLYTFGIAWSLLMTLLCFLSVFKIKNNKFIWMFLAIIGQYALITGPTSYYRYRLPADPFIIICAIAGFLFLADTLKKIKKSGHLKLIKSS